MAVYVRDLSRKEGQKLLSIARSSKCPIAMRRAQILIASDQGMKSPEIGSLYHLSADYVRKVIHRFNEEGLESVQSGYARCGRDPVFTPEECSLIVEIASTPPKALGKPFSHWSLPKLREYVIQNKVVHSISHEQIRQILKRVNWSLQRVKTWKESNDPEFASKKTHQTALQESPERQQGNLCG